MQSTDLFILGRQLMKVAEEGLPAGGRNHCVRVVLLDVGAHPGSSISAIVARTGYPQSQVSTAVGTLRRIGAVRTEADPADRRRTLVWIVPSVVERSRARVVSSADAAIARALGDADDRDVADVIGALEMVAERFERGVEHRLAEEAS
jgi:DNA-binding MarR family transcriptional regulator